MKKLIIYCIGISIFVTGNLSAQDNSKAVEKTQAVLTCRSWPGQVFPSASNVIATPSESKESAILTPGVGSLWTR